MQLRRAAMLLKESNPFRKWTMTLTFFFLNLETAEVGLGEIGEFYEKISPSAVSQNTRRMEDRLKEESKLSERVHHLKETILSNV
jgi:hypothetical protein